MDPAIARIDEYLAGLEQPAETQGCTETKPMALVEPGAALARLDEFLAQGATPEADDKFRIENKEQAIWALRKIAGMERGRQESRAAAQMEIDRIQAWLAEEEKRADQARGYLDYLLEDYHRRQLAENPRAKTIKLPHGELQLRAQQPEFQREDEAIKAWAKENRPEFIVEPPPPEPKLDWANLKKVINIANGKAVDPDSGEFIPGITVIERPEKFSIKLTGV